MRGRSVRSGDDTAFRALYDANFADIWRFARRRCDGSADADDVVAEVFAVAWCRRGDLPAGDQTRLWLFGVARNVLANSPRSAQRRARLYDRLRARPERFASDPAAVVDGQRDSVRAGLAR